MVVCQLQQELRGAILGFHLREAPCISHLLLCAHIPASGMLQISHCKASQAIARDAVDGAGMQVKKSPSAILKNDRHLVAKQLVYVQHGSNRVHKHGWPCCGAMVRGRPTSLYMELLPLTTPCSARDCLHAFGTCTGDLTLNSRTQHACYGVGGCSAVLVPPHHAGDSVKVCMTLKKS